MYSPENKLIKSFLFDLFHVLDSFFLFEKQDPIKKLCGEFLHLELIDLMCKWWLSDYSIYKEEESNFQRLVINNSNTVIFLSA